MTEPQSAEAVRASDRAHGPAGDEPVDWTAVQAEFDRQAPACAEYRAREAAYAAAIERRGRRLAARMSELLPEGMRFEWK